MLEHIRYSDEDPVPNPDGPPLLGGLEEEGEGDVVDMFGSSAIGTEVEVDIELDSVPDPVKMAVGYQLVYSVQGMVI